MRSITPVNGFRTTSGALYDTREEAIKAQAELDLKLLCEGFFPSERYASEELFDFLVENFEKIHELLEAYRTGKV